MNAVRAAGITALLVLGVVAWLSVGGWLRAREGDRLLRAALAELPARVVDRGELPRQVFETSGLAVSRAHPGTLWTHNDSGDRPLLYALDTTASLLGTFEVEGAEAIDWEALDLGPCPAVTPDPLWCLYVGDVGDNGRRREHVTVYVVPEPDPAQTDSDPKPVTPLGSLSFTYPGGPDDVEAVALAPDGTLVLVTKGRRGEMRVHRIAPGRLTDELGASAPFVLDEGVVLPLVPDLEYPVGRAATGASLHPSGARLAVRTYSEIRFYAWPPAPGMVPDAPRCYLGALEPQGEAVAYDASGRLWTTSETNRRPGRLLTVECAGP